MLHYETLVDSYDVLLIWQDTAIGAVADNLIDNVIFGFCLEIHRMAKKGVLFLEDTDLESIKQFSKLLLAAN